MQTCSLAHSAEKNGEDLPNDFILEDLNHKFESLDFSMPIICDKECFSCGMHTNSAIRLLLLGVLKRLFKFSQLLASVLGTKKNFYSSADEHLLLLMKSKIDYLQYQALKDGLPADNILE